MELYLSVGHALTISTYFDMLSKIALKYYL